MTQESILVLGIGNLLWADEGFGVRAVEELHRRWHFPDRVTLMDGGTQGFNLLPHVQAARRMIVFDAIDYGLEPGTIKVLANEQVPRFLRAKKLSLHQTGFQEVLAVAELIENFPLELVLIGVQPLGIEDYGASLNPLIKEKIPTALAIALSWLQRWGCTPESRNGEVEGMALLLPATLSMDRFDAGALSPAPTGSY
ncbi:MAG: hydrogenase expression/formation protein [Gallionellales bacterium GWA2_59_43]|nr:MAG: hydrogenase expression/formation protein [Gallionellales bacterium GWA2_59_43]